MGYCNGGDMVRGWLVRGGSGLKQRKKGRAIMNNWKAESVFVNNEPNRAIVRVNAWKGRTIADCGQDTPNNMVNAVLISTAEDLLSALEGLLRTCELNLDEMEPATQAAIEQAQAAVRKARGL